MTAQTHHAPAERASWEDLYEQMQALKKNATLQTTVEHSRDLVLLLNPHRQIVFANKACRDRLCLEDPAEIYGCRIGEAMHCIHAGSGDGGCGTSRKCRGCGGVNTVLNSLSGGKIAIERFRIETTEPETPMTWIVFTIPLLLETRRYVLVGLKDEQTETPHAFAKHAFAMQRLAAKVETHELKTTGGLAPMLPGDR